MFDHLGDDVDEFGVGGVEVSAYDLRGFLEVFLTNTSESMPMNRTGVCSECNLVRDVADPIGFADLRQDGMPQLRVVLAPRFTAAPA